MTWMLKKIASLFSLKSAICWLGIIAIFCLSTEQLFPVDDLIAAKEAIPAKTSSVGLNAQKIVKAKPAIQNEMDEFHRPTLTTQGVVLVVLSLAPFIMMILTSFLKFIVVLVLLRSALSVQQAPPNPVLAGISLLLSLFVMYPTGIKMYEAAYSTLAELPVPASFESEETPGYIITVAGKALVPLQDFLKKNSMASHQALFYRMTYKIMPDAQKDQVKPDDIIVLVPSFIMTQLKDAFQISVLLYIPFFVIDMLTSNVLLAMGMMMLSPITISTPLKLLLLVMLDGWTLILQGLVQTFR